MSGVLRVARDGVENRVQFRKGVPIFAEAADSPPLTREQAETLFYSLFSWTSGELSFEDLEPTVDEGRAFTASPSVMILEGSRRIADRSILEDLIGGPESVFACSQTSALPLFTMKLSSSESAVLKLARERGRFRARDLPFPAATLDVIRALNALVSVGLLEIVTKASALPPPPKPVTPPRTEVEGILDAYETKRVPAPVPVVESEAPPERPAPPPPAPVRPTPARRTVAIAAVFLAAAAIALLVWLSLSSRPVEDDKADPSEAVVAADSAPPAPAVLPVVNTEEPAETHREPTDAELFYSANVAFESGDFERSKAELTALLERQPDFAAARELLGRVERSLAPKPRVSQEASPSKKTNEKPPAPEPAPKEAAAAPPTPGELFESARSAFARSELETARAQLDALEAREPSYPGAWKLREEIALKLWERKLPLAFNVRHDHALGSCTGVLELTSTGYSYRSKEHEWVWSFAEVTETERRAPTRLRIETAKSTSYNFELKEPPNDEDWARHQALGRR
jgi:hypothetical protein